MNTKELILEKTLKLMIEKENSLITIREISAATGIATGGIYHYFSNKDEIYNELTEKYYMNYYKFDIDNLKKIKGNAKEKIHDIMVEIFKQKQKGIPIETIEDDVDYRMVLLILTSNGFSHDLSYEFCHNLLNELKEFFAEIVKEGQEKREIRQDFSTEEIVESLVIMYMGIQYKYDVYFIDDMVRTFENNFELEWEKIRFRE